MGGQEGARGYFYQAFASTLEALNNPNWDKIYVEFKTDNDKVDIALELNKEVKKTIQVKSSINLFSRSKIISWLDDLIDDYKADEYSLILIGNCAPDANKFIKSLNKNTNGITDQESALELKSISEKITESSITIELVPFELNKFEAIVRDSLHKYLTSKGKTATYTALDGIAKGIQVTFMVLSTKGDGISREDFDKQIMDWIELTCGSFISNSNPISQNQLFIYNQNTQSFHSDMTEIPFEEYYGYRCAINSIANKIRTLIEKIQPRKFPSSANYIEDKSTQNVDDYNKANTEKNKINSDEKPPFEMNEGLVVLNETLGNLLIANEVFAEDSSEKKKEKIEQISLLTDSLVTEEFFNLGNLKVKNTNSLINMGQDKPIGTPEQIEKYELLNELNYQLLQYELYEYLKNDLNSYSVVMLALSNVGTVYDEDIRVLISIPSDQEIFKSTDYPKDSIVLQLPKIYAETDGIIDNVFQINDDSLVIGERSNYIDPRILKSNYSLPFNNDINSGYNVDDFYNVLGDYTNCKVYSSANGKVVIELTLKKINPQESKHFSTLLLFKELKFDIELEYIIKSKNSTGNNTGKLKLKSSKNHGLNNDN